MRRIALSDDKIRRLPDTYAAARVPLLPPDLFNENGPWVCLSAHDADPTVMGHFTGRSRFFAFLRLPGGRAATLDYIRRLRASHQPPLVDDNRYLNLRLPQFPPGTAVALVRQMMLVDGGAILQTCRACHSDSGIHAVQSRVRWMRGDNASFDHAVEWETAKTIEKKLRERDFALLRRDWQ